MPPRRDLVINPYAKHIIPGGFRNYGGERGKVGARKGVKSRGNGVKRKGSGANFNSKKNGPRKTVHGSLMYTFVISGIMADITKVIKPIVYQ